jgi:hypothetical protein
MFYYSRCGYLLLLLFILQPVIPGNASWKHLLLFPRSGSEPAILGNTYKQHFLSFLLFVLNSDAFWQHFLLFFLLVLNGNASWQHFLLFFLLVLNGNASWQHFLLFFLLVVNGNAFWPHFLLFFLLVLNGNAFWQHFLLFFLLVLNGNAPGNISSSPSFWCKMAMLPGNITPRSPPYMLNLLYLTMLSGINPPLTLVLWNRNYLLRLRSRFQFQFRLLTS